MVAVICSMLNAMFATVGFLAFALFGVENLAGLSVSDSDSLENCLLTHYS